MKNIVILAAGPPKPNRNRHLEIFEGEVLIDRVIGKCRVDGTKLYVVINKDNNQLKAHLQALNDVEILYPEDERIYSTFKVALSVDEDCILVCGDLIELQSGDIEKFVNSNFKSAICKYAHPWGNNIIQKGMIRRADVGDCVNMICQEHKKEFLGKDNLYKVEALWKVFFDDTPMNPYVYNDVGTFMSYSFYHDLWSDPKVDSKGDKGLIFFNHLIYKDND